MTSESIIPGKDAPRELTIVTNCNDLAKPRCLVYRCIESMLNVGEAVDIQGSAMHQTWLAVHDKLFAPATEAVA